MCKRDAHRVVITAILQAHSMLLLIKVKKYGTFMLPGLHNGSTRLRIESTFIRGRAIFIPCVIPDSDPSASVQAPLLPLLDLPPLLYPATSFQLDPLPPSRSAIALHISVLFRFPFPNLKFGLPAIYGDGKHHQANCQKSCHGCLCPDD